MNLNDAGSILTAEHLSRKAVVYLRQSSLAQVKHNTESQRLQYALTDTARGYGFRQVEVIDCDLGASAASGARARTGFKQLLASIALGEVGLVLSRELSRLSRTDKDWCHLMELCQLFNTMIADAENLYDLNRLDDQLMLGIKGTLSVVELKTLKFRLQQGREAKARRGELVSWLAPGYVTDLAGRIVKDPNLRVQEVIALTFRKFDELGSIRQTHRWFHEEGVELPVNQSVAGHRQLGWQLPTLSFVSGVFHNPLYAGVYTWGRRPMEVSVEDGQMVKRQGNTRRAEDAGVFLPDHHAGYIDLDHYQRNQDIMRANGSNFASDEAALAVRGGQGLLTGLIRCGRCGRKLHIRYWGKSGTAARYLCSGDFDRGGEYCLGFGGATVDKRFAGLIVEAISPHGIKASLDAIERFRNENDDRTKALDRQLQQARYEAERAFAQYDQVDPNNRLVADELERRWNDALAAQHELEAELEAHAAPTALLSPADETAICALGEDFACVWEDPACPMTLKKQIARLIIHEIMVDLEEASQTLNFIVHWQGGCHTALSMPKPQSGAVVHKTTLEDLELITRMAVRYGDDEIARVLSKLGRRTGKGNRWTRARVTSIRRKHAIKAPIKSKLDPNVLTLAQATRHSGVSDTTLMRLIKANILAAGQVAPYAPLEIRRVDLDSDPVKSIVEHLKTTGKLVLDGDASGQQQSLFEENQ
ncbi:MAG: recombinase family protein [Proteobacteria bacterium]|nr:recombinase family protein [Pseudomonadota bacterium]